MKTPPSSALRAGFTLIELLAVMVILGILTFFLIQTGAGASETVRVGATRSFIATLEAQIKEHELDAGDHPPSSFPRTLDPKPTATNMGAEMLVIALWPKDGARGSEPDEGRLINTDGDDTRQSHTVFTSGAAFELADDWGNPIAYFHRRDYDEPCVYVTFDETGEPLEERVQALVNPVTGDSYNRGTFQLLSAGPDGVFGTDDDIGNFTVVEDPTQ